MIVTKSITNNLLDVFWKDGWDNCVRIKKQGKEFKIVKAYKKPPREVFSYIRTFCYEKRSQV